ncbi:Serine carboxypeptidase S28 domain containing protein [Hyaloscypha variabilis]
MGSQSSGSWKDTTARVSMLASKRLCFRYLLSTTIFVFLFILHQYLLPSVFDFSKLRDMVSKISAANVPTSGSSGPLNLTVELPIDHFNPQDTRTFKNRYWLNDTFYEKGGPVFLYDAGEAGVPSGAAQRLLNNDQIVFAPLELAKKYHGMAIVWEHRFYGESLPFTLNITTGLAAEGYDAYKYLNNEQALEDVVCFANHFQPPGHENDILTSDSTPWIWIGGSYPGIRAAIIRQRNPDAFFASWSSSGPVKTQVDGSPSNCSADIHAAITYADNVLLEGSPDGIDILKRAIYYSKILNPKANSSLPNYPEYPCDLNYWEIASILSYPFQGSFLSFQSFGYQLALSKFCNTIETWNPSNATNFTFSSNSSDLEINSLNALPTSAGVSANYSPKDAFYAYMYASIEKRKADFAFFPGRSRSMPDTVSWTWQLCTQFAQFQVSQYPSPKSIISRFYNVTAHKIYFCHELFPYAPEFPQVDEILKYGGWEMRPSNVMFTNGELDPWRTEGVQADTGINPQALNRKTTTVVPKCNEPPPADEVFGIVYPGQRHVSDLSRKAGNVTGNPVDEGLALFGEALDAWLPYFKAKVKRDSVS